MFFQVLKRTGSDLAYNRTVMAVFMHIDMDAFFAAIEALDFPAYRGKPLVVGADPREGKGRGVVSTASYEAREYGIHSAMPIRHAYQRCPQAVFVRPRMKRYLEVSDTVMQVFRRFTPRIQPISLDEAFLDVTGCERLFGEAEAMARTIKDEVRQATGLTCSVGVSQVKSVAKVASDLEKPDGLTVVPAGEERALLAPLGIRKLWGIGPKAAGKLKQAGIHLVADIQARPKKELVALMGKAAGEHYWKMAHAIDPREVHDNEKVKSISHETTFISDARDPEVLQRTLLWLADKVATRLRRKGFVGRTITLKYRTASFRTYTRRTTLDRGTDHTDDLFETAKELLGRLACKGGAVRLLGISASGLETGQGRQGSLFDRGEDRKDHTTDDAVDRVRRKFGSKAIVRGSLLDEGAKKKSKAGSRKKTRDSGGKESL